MWSSIKGQNSDLKRPDDKRESSFLDGWAVWRWGRVWYLATHETIYSPSLAFSKLCLKTLKRSCLLAASRLERALCERMLVDHGAHTHTHSDKAEGNWIIGGDGWTRTGNFTDLLTLVLRSTLVMAEWYQRNKEEKKNLHQCDSAAQAHHKTSITMFLAIGFAFYKYTSIYTSSRTF